MHKWTPSGGVGLSRVETQIPNETTCMTSLDLYMYLQTHETNCTVYTAIDIFQLRTELAINVGFHHVRTYN